MKTIRRLSSLTLRNLRARKSRTALTTLGIVLGVAVILGISITNISTLAAFKDTIDSITGRADFWINAPSDAGFDERNLERVRQINGVAVANPGISRSSLLIKGKSKQDLQIAGIDPTVDRRLRDYKVRAGRFLSQKDKLAVLLVEDFARNNGIRLNRKIILATDRGFVRFKVVGLIANQGAGRFVGGNVAFMPLKTAQSEFSLRGKFSYMDAKAVPGRDLKAVQERIRGALGENFIVEQPEKRIEAITETLGALQIGLSFFSAVALFVGGFLIFNTLSMVVVERTRELGMLRSMGATRAQIGRLVLYEAAGIGAVGSLFGVFFGMGLAKGLLFFVSETIQSNIAVFRVPFWGLVTSVVVGISVSIISAMQPAVAAGRISPVQAVRVQARRNRLISSPALSFVAILVLALGFVASYRPQFFSSQPGELVGQVGAFLLLLGAALLTPSVVGPLAAVFRVSASLLMRNEGRLAADSLGRVRGRTAATVSAVMISLAMLMSVGGMTESFKDSVNRWVERSVGADILVSGQPSDLSFEKSFISKLRRVPGVKIVTPIRFFRVRAGNDWITWRTIEPRTFRKMADLQFVKGKKETAWRRLRHNDSVFISTVLANRLRKNVGDSLTIKTNLGDRRFKIAGVIVEFAGEMGDVVLGTRTAMKRYFGLDDANVFRIKVKTGASPRIVADRIKSRFGKERSLDIQDAQEFRSTVNRQVNVSFAAFNVIILIAVIVAVIGIVNTLMMNILERRREIGVLRAIGSTRWQIRRMILAEAAITSACGFILGLILGTYMSINVVQGMHSLTGYDVSYIFPWSVVWISGAIALLFSTLVALLPAQAAARINIVEAVQYE